MEDKQGYPSDLADKVLVRMPYGMRDRLKTAAKANNRTMNAEIVARLDQSLGAVGMDEAAQHLPLHAAKIDQLEMRIELATSQLESLRVQKQFAERELSTVERVYDGDDTRRPTIDYHRQEVQQLVEKVSQAACKLKELEDELGRVQSNMQSYFTGRTGL